MVENLKDSDSEATDESNQESDLKVLNDELQNRVAQLEEGIASRDGELTALKESLTGAVAKYRTAVLASVPEVPADLIKGDTIEALDVSLATAKGIVEQVKAQLQGEAKGTTIPAGAPTRTGPELEGLSGEALIKYALEHER